MKHMSGKTIRRRQKKARQFARSPWVFIGPSEQQTIQWYALSDPTDWSKSDDVRIFDRVQFMTSPETVQ